MRALLVTLLLLGCYTLPTQAENISAHWQQLEPLPGPGVAGPFAGSHNGALVIADGDIDRAGNLEYWIMDMIAALCRSRRARL